MLGIRKKGETQIDLYVGDFYDFSCDGWVLIGKELLKDSYSSYFINGISFEKHSCKEQPRLIESPIDTRLFHCTIGHLHVPIMTLAPEYSQIRELLSTLKLFAAQSSIGHIGAVFDEDLSKNASFIGSFFGSLQAETYLKPISRITILLNELMTYQLWQKTFWTTWPEEISKVAKILGTHDHSSNN